MSGRVNMRTPETMNPGTTSTQKPKKRRQAVEDRAQEELRGHVERTEESFDTDPSAANLAAGHPEHPSEEESVDRRGEDRLERLTSRRQPDPEGTGTADRPDPEEREDQPR